MSDLRSGGRQASAHADGFTHVRQPGRFAASGLPVLCIVAVLAILSAPNSICQPVFAQLTAEQVRESIDSGVRFLKSQQGRDGKWDTLEGQEGGVTALVALSMLNAGVSPADESLKRALEYLRSLEVEREMTYATALITMVLCAAEPQRDRAIIERNVDWLERSQNREGQDKGGWGYFLGLSRADNSNSQFAILALHEAAKVGVEVDQQVWGRAKAYWLRGQRGDGGWGYLMNEPGSGSMTCAGVAGLIITSENFRDEGEIVAGTQINCCGATGSDQERIERGLQWLADHFAVSFNPGPRDGIGANYPLYYLYGLERAGRLSGRRFIGNHDWYREGTEHLLAEQQEHIGGWKGTTVGPESNAVIATSFALLFLSKGKRPIVISKYKHGPGQDWNRHHKGVHFLTRELEKRWEQAMNWQTIDAAAADTNDLLSSPVLFISGKDGLRLAREQKRYLREYVEQGGFIFAEACDGDGCDGKAFDRDFRALMRDVFPDGSLDPLPIDHPVWYAQEPMQPDPERPLLGIRACCRTSVIYCPRNLSCLWQLSQPSRYATYPEEVQAEIDQAMRIGVNVMTYATNRELKEKLDRPQIVTGADEDLRSRDVLTIPKLAHTGGADDAPVAWPNVLQVLEQQLELRVNADNELITAEQLEVLARYPLLFTHGRRDFEWSEAERANLRQFFDNGGFLLADSICASQPFAEAFRREMEQIFSAGALQPIPADHPMYTRVYRGFDVTSVTMQTPFRVGDGPISVRSSEVPPRLEGIEVNGRYVVVFSPLDISCAMENAVSTECKGYQREDAARIAVNVLLYALLQ